MVGGAGFGVEGGGDAADGEGRVGPVPESEGDASAHGSAVLRSATVGGCEDGGRVDVFCVLAGSVEGWPEAGGVVRCAQVFRGFEMVDDGGDGECVGGWSPDRPGAFRLGGDEGAFLACPGGQFAEGASCYFVVGVFVASEEGANFAGGRWASVDEDAGSFGSEGGFGPGCYGGLVLLGCLREGDVG